MPHQYRDGEVFVFGSNTAGIHGAGAAADAMNLYGAVWGQGIGRHGMSYAIPTKSQSLKTLALETIKEYADDFIAYAMAHPEDNFFLTRIGCGLAGYTDSDIAPMFKGAPLNVRKPDGW